MPADVTFTFPICRDSNAGVWLYLVVLPSVDKGAVDAGLKYVNNDACYPSILVTGQIMEALLSGKYDLEKDCCNYIANWRRMPCY
mgnify:CR=1 FL=1